MVLLWVPAVAELIRVDEEIVGAPRALGILRAIWR